MAPLDIVLLLLFIPGIVRGITKGLIEQAAALATIIISGKLAFTFSGELSVWLEGKIQVSDQLLYIIAFLLIIVICSVVIMLVSKLFTKFIEALSLGWINRVLGVIFSLFTTALVLGLVFTLLIDLNSRFIGMDLEFLNTSLIYPWIKDFCDLIFPHFKHAFDAGVSVVASV